MIPKETLHHYRGYDIIGTHYISSGGPVLGGRYDVPAGAYKRTYHVKKDGRYVFHPGVIIEYLKDAKEEIDEYIERQEVKKMEQAKLIYNPEYTWEFNLSQYVRWETEDALDDVVFFIRTFFRKIEEDLKKP